MTNVIHPDEETLLRFVDQDLSTGEARSLEQHFSVCGRCRDDLTALRETSEDFRRFHLVHKAGLPAPPRAWDTPRWSDLANREQPARRLAAFPVKPLLAAAAAIIAAVFLVRWIERPPSVSAAELLRRAEVREQAAANPRRRIRIRYQNRVWTRPGRLDPVVRPQAGDPAVIDAMLRQAGFDTEDPLSAAAFARWRNSLPERHDEVRQDSESYTLTTAAPAGVLRQASLTFRSRDLHASSATLRYRTDDTLDMDELPPDPGELEVSRPQAPAPSPNPVVPAAPSPTAGLAEEVQVVAALHRVGADLGDPVEVERNADGIFITGAGLPASRQDEIRAAVSDIPGVRVAFEAGSGRRPNGAALPQLTAAPADASNPLLEQLRAAANPDADPGDALIDADDHAVQRAYALAALARRFPPPVETTLTARDRTAVRAIALDHSNALSVSVVAMSTLLAPVVPPAPAAPGALANWQETAENVMAAARDVDQELNAGSTSDLESRKARLGGALARLRRRAGSLQAPQP
jgi:hypothetical protein